MVTDIGKQQSQQQQPERQQYAIVMCSRRQRTTKKYEEPMSGRRKVREKRDRMQGKANKCTEWTRKVQCSAYIYVVNLNLVLMALSHLNCRVG